MNETSKFWSDFLAYVLAALLAGMAGAFGWFKKSKDRLYEKMEKLEVDTDRKMVLAQGDYDRRYDKIEVQMREVWVTSNEHEVQLGKLMTTVANTACVLEDLKLEGREQNRKLDQILSRGHTVRKGDSN